MKVIDLTKRPWQWAAIFIMAFIWGTSFILMKRGLQSYSSFQVGALRIFFSFILLLPFMLRNYKKVNLLNIKSLLIIGFAGNFFPAFLFTTAQTQISSALSGMLNSLTPFFTLLIGVFLYKRTASKMNIIGIVVGLIGAVSLILQGNGDFLSGNNWFGIFAVIATMLYGFSTNETKSLSGMNGVTIASLAFMFTGPVAGVYLLTSDFTQALQTPNHWENLGYIFVLAAFSSVLAIIIFNEVIKHTTAIFASSVTYIIPAFAILWGVFDGETITFLHILSISVIMGGVYLVNLKRSDVNKITFLLPILKIFGYNPDKNNQK